MFFIQILSKKEINSCVNIIISFCEFYIFPNACNIDNNYSNTKFFVFSYTHTHRDRGDEMQNNKWHEMKIKYLTFYKCVSLLLFIIVQRRPLQD